LMFTSVHAILSEILKPFRIQFGIARGVRDVSVPQAAAPEPWARALVPLTAQVADGTEPSLINIERRRRDSCALGI
jgi:hypothetical protein